MELQGQHAHADQVGAVDALEALGDDGPDAEQGGALGGPVTAAPRPVLLAGQHDQGHALVGVAHGRLVDGRLGAVGEVQRDAALGARRQEVAQADVGEGAAHHHLVVAAAGAVGVEVLGAPRRGRSGSARPAWSGPMEPAGEMWSVVTLSPSRASTRASTMSVTGAGVIVMPSKNGGFLT